jgi:hypothetical protein
MALREIRGCIETLGDMLARRAIHPESRVSAVVLCTLHFLICTVSSSPCPSCQAPNLSLRPVDALPAQFDSQGVVAWGVAGYPAAEHWRATLQLQL